MWSVKSQKNTFQAWDFLGLLFLAYLDNRQIDKNIKASVAICSWSNYISAVLFGSQINCEGFIIV